MSKITPYVRRGDTDVGCITGCLMLLTFIFVVGLITLGWGLLITWAWNALFPYLFGWPVIEIYQGIAISILTVVIGSAFRSRK